MVLCQLSGQYFLQGFKPEYLPYLLTLLVALLLIRNIDFFAANIPAILECYDVT